MIELKNVSKFYNDNNIVTIGLRNVSLKLNKGEFVAITGDSGSGKSTLLNVISSIDNYDEGEILFYGNETFYFNQNDSDAFRKNNISFIFQKYNIVDSYTVLQNVMLPLLIKGISEDEAKIQATEIITKVGLSNRINNKGSKLSGGEKQRCVIARALATDAPILACDEPTGNLDSKTSEEIIKLIKEVAKDKLVLVVTHDFESIKNVCTRKIKLSDGEIVEDITYKEGIEEETKELVLKNERPCNKTLFKLSFLNILSTPKKSIFTALVFTFVCVLLLILSLVMVKASYEANYTYSNKYEIISEDRMIIYSYDHESLDISKINDLIKDYEYYENAFFEEINVEFITNSNISIYGKFTYHKLDYQLLKGNEIQNDDEFMLIIPINDYHSYYEPAIGKEISIVSRSQNHYTYKIGKLVGIATSQDVNSTYIMGSNYNKNIVNIIINSAVNLTYETNISSNSFIKQIYQDDISESYIAVPSSLKDSFKIKFNLNQIYSFTYDIEVKYIDDLSTPVFYYGDDYSRGEIEPNFNGVKELTVYTKNIRKLTKSINNLGYNVSIPSMVENNQGVSLIILYLLSIVTIVALIIMFYISFAIIQRIILTKTKDYSIFRTLGLISKDLKKMLLLEVLIITIFSIVFGAILTNIIITTTKIDLYKYVNFNLIIVYVILMIIFGLLTAIRLNNKIFKNSVYQGLREGGE